MDIFEILRDQEENYINGEVNLGKYVTFDMYDVIQKISAYLNSTHITGDTDSLGRPKPFFNIVTAAANIWYRATDLDRKDIKIIPSESQQVALSLVANIILQDWMNKNKFGHFLNDWGRTLARYGSAVVKFTKSDGNLIPQVISWDNLIVDQVNFNSNPVIEKFYLTPAELRQKKEYNQEIVKKLIETNVKKLIETKQTREDLEGKLIDSKADYIEVYEIHGNLPLSLLTGKEEDADTFRQQMWAVSYLEDDGKYKDFALYSGKEEKSPYMITHLIEETNRTLAVGAVEYLFDAQWMVNHTIKQQKDYLDLASKMIFQTADPRFIGRNAINAIEVGDILQHQPNMPLTLVNNSAMNISAMQNFGLQWQSLSRELTSTPDAVRGNTLPSGTPYSLGAILTQNASSLFEIMTENKGLYLEDMLREFVIPHLKSKMDTSEEIGAILDDQTITQLDTMFIPREAVRRYNKEAIDEILNEETPTPFQKGIAEDGVKQDLAILGNMRFVKPSEVETVSWKKLLQDFEWKVQVQVTNEPSDKQAVLQTLSTVLQTIASNPMMLQNKNAQLLFNKILNQTGIVSPVEFSALSTPSPLQPPQGEMAPLSFNS